MTLSFKQNGKKAARIETTKVHKRDFLKVADAERVQRGAWENLGNTAKMTIWLFHP